MVVKGIFPDEYGMFITIKFYGTFRLLQSQTVNGVYRFPNYEQGEFTSQGFMYVSCHNPKNGEVRAKIEEKVAKTFEFLKKQPENDYFYEFFDKKTRKQFQKIAQFKESTGYQLTFD